MDTPTHAVAGSCLECSCKLGVELRTDTAGPSAKHLVPQPGVGPGIPSDQTTGEPLASHVLDLVIFLIGVADAARATPVLMVHHLGTGATLQARRVGTMLVFPMARGSNPLDRVALREDDDVLPVVLVGSYSEYTADELVLLEVVFVP